MPPPLVLPDRPDNPAWDPACLACGLCRTSLAYRVWGEGDPRAAVVLLGEALGEEEEATGRPFQGRAGWILNRALHEAGIPRHTVFIANAVKCRPTNAQGKNRPPTVEELTHCRSWLDEELDALPNKKVVVAMGASALWAMMAPHVPPGGVFETQGRTFFSERYQVQVVATVHPGLVLRKPGEAQWLPLDFRKAVEIAATGRLPAPPDPTIHVVRTLAQALHMRDTLARAPSLTWDWETGPNLHTFGDALHPMQAIGFCVSFCGAPDTAWVVPRFGANFSPLWHRADLPRLDAILREVFLNAVPKIGHHVAFDCNITLSTLGVRPVHVVGCTMVAHHLLLNHLTERAHGLKRMSDCYTPYGRYDDEIDAWLTAHGHTKNAKPDGAFMYRVANEILWKYNGIDAIVPWLIHPQLETRLRAAGLWTLYTEERVPLAVEYADLDRRGVPVARERVTSLAADMGDAMEGVRTAIGRQVITWNCPIHKRVFQIKCCENAKGGLREAGFPGEPLNPNSGPQVAAYLYEQQGLPILARTETGLPSTKEEVLKEYVEADPLVPAILNYRGYSKLKGTYLDGKTGQGGILVAVDPDGYVHPSTMLTVVETLRLATRKPFPVHLIPRPLLVWHCPVHGRYRLEEAPCCATAVRATLNIRGMVRPRSTREVLLAADFDQQEYVIASIAAKQQDLEEACLDRGEDAHAYVMRILGGVTKAQFQTPTGQWLSPSSEADYINARSYWKSVNFMVLYLGGPSHLARATKITEAKAHAQIEAYYARLPQIRLWQYDIIQKLRATGTVQGLFGVSRALPNIYSPYRGDQNEAERQACNFPFQNGGAHVLFRALLRITARWRKEKFPGRVLFTVHDEILAICRRDVAREGMAALKEEMERPHPELVGACGMPRGIRASVKALEEWGGPAISV